MFAYLNLKIGVCVGSDEGEVGFRGRIRRWGRGVGYVDVSPPIVVKWQKWEEDGSGLKDRSKGQAVGSDFRCSDTLI